MTQKQEAINLKMSKAFTFLEEVDILMHHSFFTTAINRLYYACFHATNALLLSKDLFAKTHNGVTSLLHQNFVKNGLFDVNQALFFSRLMQERIDDDYSDYLILVEDEVKPYIEPAKKYVAYVSELLKQQMQ